MITRIAVLLGMLPISILLMIFGYEINGRLHMPTFGKVGRSYIIYRESSPYVHFKAAANQHVVLEKELSNMNRYAAESVFTTNALGYRGRMPAYDTGAIRILVLGGSVMVNGSTDSTTVTGYLESKLNEVFARRARVVCWNGGIVSCISNQEYSAYVHDFLPYRPQIVIMIDSLNDFWNAHLFEKRPGYPSDFKETEESPWINFLRRYSLFFLEFDVRTHRYMRYALGYDEYPFPPQNIPIMENVLENYFSVIERMLLINDALGVNTFVYLQPVQKYTISQFAPFANPQGWHEKMSNITDFYYSRVWQRFQQWNKTYNAFGKSSAHFGELTGLELYRNPNLFWDMAHMYDEGNEIIADAVIPDLIPAIEHRLTGNLN